MDTITTIAPLADQPSARGVFPLTTDRLHVPTPDDGAPIGIRHDDTRKAYRLHVAGEVGTSTVEVERVLDGRLVGMQPNRDQADNGNLEPGEAIILPIAGDSLHWHHWRELVLEEINARLAAKGMPPGSWPEPGGSVLIHPAIGREIEYAVMLCADRVEAERLMPVWMEMAPGERMALWQQWKDGVTAPRDWSGLEAAIDRMCEYRQKRARGERLTVAASKAEVEAQRVAALRAAADRELAQLVRILDGDDAAHDEWSADREAWWAAMNPALRARFAPTSGGNPKNLQPLPQGDPELRAEAVARARGWRDEMREAA